MHYQWLRGCSGAAFLILASGSVAGCQSDSMPGAGLSSGSTQTSSTSQSAPSTNNSGTSTTSTSTSTAPTAETGLGVLDSGCMTNLNYDTCIFYKNPVFENKAAFSPAISPSTNLTQLQIYGVKLKGLDSSGYLSNSSYSVNPGNGLARVQKNAQGNWKYAFSADCSGTSCTADHDHKIGQLMAFFWLNHQVEAMTAQTGKFYAKDKGITVKTYESNMANAYWDGDSILMGDGGSSTKTEFALGAEVYLHEAGHANLQFAATGTIGSASTCNSSKGCISGINEGQADYHAAIVFPDNGVPVGETAMNSPQGMVECGMTRAIGANKNTTAQQAYDACSSMKGEVHLMGRVYASVWWEVRSKATSNPKEVDQLFTEHLKSLQNSDDFTTALTKIKAVDKALFNSKYSADFADEFSRRGV